MLSLPEKQDGGHIILSGCYGGCGQAIDVGVVQWLSNQCVHISKIDPQQEPKQQQQQQQHQDLVDLGPKKREIHPNLHY